jgi:hypothetical protein
MPEAYNTADSWYREYPAVCPMTYMLPYLSDSPDSDDEEDMMRQPMSIRNLLQQFEAKHPQIFTQFEKFKAPRFFIRRVFRQIISFVAASIDTVKPVPHAIGQQIENLYNRLARERPSLIRMLSYFGIPYSIIKASVMSLIRFVVDAFHSPAGSPDLTAAGPIEKVVKMMGTAGIMRELAAVGIPESEGNLLVESVARYVSTHPMTQGNANQKASVLTEKIIQDTRAYRAMTARGILPARARSIIREIVLSTLREIQ